jgi:hypothetical protein
MSDKMWRMALFIRHNCDEHKNTVGHRWSNKSKMKQFFFNRGRHSYNVGRSLLDEQIFKHGSSHQSLQVHLYSRSYKTNFLR